MCRPAGTLKPPAHLEARSALSSRRRRRGEADTCLSMRSTGHPRGRGPTGPSKPAGPPAKAGGWSVERVGRPWGAMRRGFVERSPLSRQAERAAPPGAEAEAEHSEGRIRRARSVPAGDERPAKPWQSATGISRAAHEVKNLPHKPSPLPIRGIRHQFGIREPIRFLPTWLTVRPRSSWPSRSPIHRPLTSTFGALLQPAD